MEKYRKIKTLGRGSFGAAILVRRVSDHEKFVLKRIDTSRMSAKEKQEVQVEIDVLSHLNSPCIVQYHEHFTHKKGTCIVMEYADGGDLSDQIDHAKNAGRYISEDAILNWFVQICMGLKHCHDRKILHRDLKSQNIFLTATGKVKLGDFGIARVLLATAEMASTVVGTPYYLSPEIVENKKYNSKSDIWSLGVVLYELAALQVPFSGSNLPQLVINITRGQFPPAPVHFSKQLHELINSMLKHDPKERPAIAQLLRLPATANRIRAVFGATMASEEMSHTVLHGKQHAPLAHKRKPANPAPTNSSGPSPPAAAQGACPMQDAAPARAGFAGHAPKSSKPAPRGADEKHKVTPPAAASHQKRRPPGVHGRVTPSADPGSGVDAGSRSAADRVVGGKPTVPWWEKNAPAQPEKKPFLTRGSGSRASSRSPRPDSAGSWKSSSPPVSRGSDKAASGYTAPGASGLTIDTSASSQGSKVQHSPTISTARSAWSEVDEAPVKSPAQLIKQSLTDDTPKKTMGAAVGIDFSEMEHQSTGLLTGSTAILGTTSIMKAVESTNWQTCTWKKEAACFWNAAPPEDDEFENEIAMEEAEGSAGYGGNKSSGSLDVDEKAREDEAELINMLQECLMEDEEEERYGTCQMPEEEEGAELEEGDEEVSVEALEFEVENMRRQLKAELGGAGNFEQVHRVVQVVVHKADATGRVSNMDQDIARQLSAEVGPVAEHVVREMKQLVDLEEGLEGLKEFGSM